MCWFFFLSLSFNRKFWQCGSSFHSKKQIALSSSNTMATTGHTLFEVPSWIRDQMDPTNKEWLGATDQAARAQRYHKCTLGGMQQPPVWVQAVLSIPPTKTRIGMDGHWESVSVLPTLEEILKEMVWVRDRNANIS